MRNRKRLWLAAMFGLLVLAQTAHARVILWEDFSTTYNGTLPVGWDVVDNLGENPRWTTDNYCLWEANNADWNLIYYPFASADNACQPRFYPDTDTDLISNEIDLSLFSDVTITFDADCVRAIPGAAAVIDPSTSIEVYTGSAWSAVSGYDPVDDTWGNDAAYPFNLSTLADGNDSFALRWNFTAVETETDNQIGWCAIDNILVEGECPDTTNESLIVDDGTINQDLYGYGYDESFVTCIEPSTYPSYLTEISAFFIDPQDVIAGTSPVHFAVWRGTIADGPEPYPIWQGDDFVPNPGPTGQWLSEDVSEDLIDNPLAFGAWCLGVIFNYGEFQQNQWIGVDNSVTGHSWRGSPDGPWYWSSFEQAQIEGTAMIRGEADYCVEGASTTTTTTTTTGPSTTTTTQPQGDDDSDDDSDDDADDDADDDLDDTDDDADGASSVSPLDEEGLGGGSCDFACGE